MMRMNIQDPDSFEFASAVSKNSKTGITSNRRLLVIRGGHLYYYSNVPKSFNGDPKSLEYFHELPKGSVALLNIKRIKSHDQYSCDFSIYFDAMFMMQREDIRKTLTNPGYEFTPRETKEEVIWQFTCDNHFIKQKWVALLQLLVEHYVQQDRKINNYFENIDLSNSEDNAFRTTVKTPWRESAIERKSYLPADYKLGEFGLTPKGSLKLVDPVFKKKKEELMLFPNSLSESKLESFEMSYQQPKMKIEEAFSLSPVKMKKEHSVGSFNKC